MTTYPKPRYPAVVFHRLKNYPCRHCDHCGRQLTPRLLEGNKLETRQNFEKRKTCDKTCWSALMANKRQAKREGQTKTSPPVEPVLNAGKGPGGLVAPEARQGSPPKPPGPIQVDFKNPRITSPAPCAVCQRPPKGCTCNEAGQLEPAVQNATSIPTSFILQPELAKQGVTTIEQVEAMTDDELLVLPRVTKAKLKMLRSQIAGVKKVVPDPTPQDDEQPTGQEAPTLADPVYGGPPAPENVAEEALPEPSMVVEKPGMAEPGEPDSETWRPGELKAGQLIAGWIPEARKDPALNRPVRPVKLPSAAPPQRPPAPPPSLQAKLPDPRPQAAPYTVTEGEVIERGDFGTCPTEGCGERLNAFGKCRNCEQRAAWLKGQRRKVGVA